MKGVGDLDKVVASSQIALEGLEDGNVVLVLGRSNFVDKGLFQLVETYILAFNGIL